MKRIVFFIATLLISVPHVFAQEPSIGCIDKVIKLDAEDLKAAFVKQGMTTYRDAMMNMVSRQPFPIAVQLEKGQTYQFIYVGSKESSRMIMELYDGNDKRLDMKKIKPNPYEDKSNYILYSFIPTKTDLYLVVLTQIQRHNKMCGSFTIMQKGGKKIEKAMPDKAQKMQQGSPAMHNPRYVPNAQQQK